MKKPVLIVNGQLKTVKEFSALTLKMGNLLYVNIGSVNENLAKYPPETTTSLRINMLVLIRGLPGSGKTTKAQEYINCGFVHFESDIFMCDSTGKYFFRRGLLHLTHKLCLLHTQEALKAELSVVVSNTFTTHKELKPYRELAESLDVKLVEITCTGDYGNTHGVPPETIQMMKERWQD